MEPLLILVLIGVGIAIISWCARTIVKSRKYDELKPKLDSLDRKERDLLSKATENEQQFAIRAKEIETKQQAAELRLQEKQQAIELIAKQKAVGFPWLANAYADFYHLEEMKIAGALETKSHPAYSAAKKVREVAQRRREAERAGRIYKYQIEFYENMFPWLEDLKSEEIEDELIRIRSGNLADSTEEDPVKKWLTPEEYARLPVAEKNQIALDRYWKKKKNKWEIGRDYERYV